MKIGNREFDLTSGHVYIMGILNVTPDSFSDGGKFRQEAEALRHVEEMVAQGADIIDVGGESTRPGSQKVAVEEEILRVTGIIAAIKRRFPVPVSIDTYKAPVLQAAVDEGADLANDVWGLRYDSLFDRDGNLLPKAGDVLQEGRSPWGTETMAQLVARYQLPVCIMHNRPEAQYKDFLTELEEDLEQSLQLARQAGISRDQIILDPGVGFGKSYENNLQVLANLDRLRKWELPLLLAASRKSVIGTALDLPVEEREEGTIVTSVLAAMAGWQFVRVHDVEKNARALKMAEQILKQKEQGK